ncbi:extracellular solute-binding protein [Homoserinimonas sp. OAct 916]|uniref:extracellular solute-binding protein n=1 Tax=Homoserinimonas sp. OAct 916 TaxID=2211450 RepID=UPI0013005CF1|nr:extracellular solute-binding protein [Homoserinimonas sp. OAct 916]
MKKTLWTSVTLLSVGALVLTGCSQGASTEPIPPVTNPVAGQVADGILKGQTVTYAADGGTTQDAQMKAFFTPFAEASGVTINQDSPQTLAKITAQVQSKNYQWDFVSAVADTVARNCGVLFEKLDMAKIDTSQVPDGLLGGTECGVPSIPYAIVQVYDTGEFGANGPVTWADFFDVAKFPGTRAIYSGDGVIDSATVQAGSIAAGWDPKTPYTADWANKGIDQIEKIKNNIAFYTTGAQAQQMLESGEAKLGAVWNGRALAAEKNGTKLTPTWDNWISIVDQFAIIKGTPKSEIAYYAINYAMGAEQQAKWTELSGYSPVNKNAKPNIDDLTKKYITTTPERAATAVPVQLDFWKDEAAVSALQDRWSSVVAGG